MNEYKSNSNHSCEKRQKLLVHLLENIYIKSKAQRIISKLKKKSYLHLVTGSRVLLSLFDHMVERVFFTWPPKSRCLQRKKAYIMNGPSKMLAQKILYRASH